MFNILGMPELKLYTVAELREWLMHNRAAEGLSEQVIAPTRAWAIIHNPYVKDEDPVMAAIFEDGKNVAYTIAFPELIEGKRYWWFSSLWCNPTYQGNGFGLIVIGSLAEVYGVEYCLDKWGAPETVGIFTNFHHKTFYTLRYILGVQINKTTIKGKVVHMFRYIQTGLHRLGKHYSNKSYTIRYITYIDNITYDFIKLHSGKYYFIHTQDYLNWVLHYSFSVSAPLMDFVKVKMPFFASEKIRTQLYAVQILDGKDIIGFYMMKQNDNGLHILYLYYNELKKEKVFASIRDHVKCMHIHMCELEHRELAEYLSAQIYFPKNKIEKVSLSLPSSMKQPHDGELQYGDGDGFV